MCNFHLTFEKLMNGVQRIFDVNKRNYSNIMLCSSIQARGQLGS